jgi:hypothetical protein
VLRFCFSERRVAAKRDRMLFSCPTTAVIRQKRRFAQWHFMLLKDLMCFHNICGVVSYVHEDTDVLHVMMHEMHIYVHIGSGCSCCQATT